MGYPKASCRKPPVPYGTSEFDAEQYDYDVDRYIRCVNTYIDNANNDIERIAEAVKDLKREAERRY